MTLNGKYRARFREVASRTKYKTIFACKAVAGRPVYRMSVSLEKVVIGTQCGEQLEQWVARTGDHSRVSKLLADSPYVAFLKDIESEPLLLNDTDFLSRHAYFSMGMIAIQQKGNYFNACDADGMFAQMRHFYNLFDSAKRSVPYFASDGCVSRTRPDEPVWAYKIADSTVFELEDGHHRTAVAFAQGKTDIDVLIVGEKPSYLQRLVRESNGSEDCELAEPLNLPDVSGWKIDDFTQQYWAAIHKFDEEHRWLSDAKDVLCVSAGYGLACRNWLSYPVNVTGVLNSSSRQIQNLICGALHHSRYTVLDEKGFRFPGEGFDTVCLEVGRGGKGSEERKLAQQLRQCIDSQSVRRIYVAIHPRIWMERNGLNSLFAFENEAKKHFEVHQIREPQTYLGDSRDNRALVLAMQRLA